MSDNVSEYMLRRLLQRLGRAAASSATPATGSTASWARCDKAEDRPRFIQARHEEMAAFMACAHAKFTGEVGVCMATSGPGAIHLLNGLYDAKMDHQPVVAIVGQQARAGARRRFPAGGRPPDSCSRMSPTSTCTTVSWTRPQMRHLVDRALRIATDRAHRHVRHRPQGCAGAGRRARAAAHAHGTVHSGLGYFHAAASYPRTPTCSAPPTILNAGQKVAMLVGPGRLDAAGRGDSRSPICSARASPRRCWAKRSSPDDLPYVHRHHRPAGHQAELGHDDGLRHTTDGRLQFSVLGVPARRRARPEACRSTSTAGCSACATRWTSTSSAMRATRSGRSCRCSSHKQDRSWREKIERETSAMVEMLDGARAMQNANPINPQRVFWELVPRLPDSCILTVRLRLGRQLVRPRLQDPRAGMMASLSGQPGDDGPGRALCHRGQVRLSRPRRSSRSSGDGAMQMNGLNAAASPSPSTGGSGHDPRLVVLVLNNRDLNQVTWEHARHGGRHQVRRLARTCPISPTPDTPS